MAQISFTSVAPGNATVPHGLGSAPTTVDLLMTSGGQFWFQQPTAWDNTNFYLVASDTDVSCIIFAYTSAPTPTGIVSSGSTVTLQSIVDFARTIPELMPILSVGGISSQPALSIANQVMTSMLSPSMNWKFNRFLPPVFYTNSLQQDYAVPGVVNLGWIEDCYIIDINNTQVPKPLGPIEVVRTIPVTSWQWGRIGQVSWLQNNTLIYGQWVANQSYSAILGMQNCPTQPFTQIQDPNGNFWVVSNNLNNTVTTGNVQPTWPATGYISYPTPANPNQPATTVSDGTAVWTAVNPSGQGYRVYPIPPINGLFYEIHIIGQLRPPRFVNMAQVINPIPDDYSDYFKDGFIAFCYMHSKEAKVRDKFQSAFAIWQAAMQQATSKSAREREGCGLYPSEGIQSGGYVGYGGPATPYWPGGS